MLTYPEVVRKPTSAEVHDTLFDTNLVKGADLALVRIFGPRPDGPRNSIFSHVDKSSLLEPAFHARGRVKVQAGLFPGTDK